MNLRDRALVGVLSLALIALSITALAPTLRSADADAEPTPGPTTGRGYVEGVLGRALNASPFGARSAADRALVALLFRGLVRLGPDSSLTGDLAQRWEASEDGRRWTFHLRPNQFWHDGEPITADDVVYTIDVLGDDTYTGPGAESWREVRATAPDPLTVRFDLATPLGGFLQAATQPIAPLHMLAGVPTDRLPDDPFGREPTGSGPFRLVFLDAARAFLTAATPIDGPGGFPGGEPGGPDFRTPRPTDSFATPRPTARPDIPIPYLSTFELRWYDDVETLAGDWEAGRLDAISGLQPMDMAELGSTSGATLLRYPGTTLIAAALNLRAARPTFQDARVRRALLQAVDRDAIVTTVLGGLGARADSLVPPSSPMFDAAQSPELAFDAAAARDLLVEAGWQDREAGWVPKGASEPLVIELLSPEETVNPAAYQAAIALMAGWKDLGLAVRLVPLPAAELVGDRLARGEFQAAIVPLAIGLDPDVYPLLASSQTRTGGSNVVGLQDLELDKLLEAARTPVAVDARHAAYVALQQRLAAQQYILPLAFRDDYVLFRDTIVGPESRPVGAAGDRFWDVLTWRLADGS